MERAPSLEKSPSKLKRIKKGEACKACRTKKCRCNASKPTCATCARDNEPECVYDAPRSKTQILRQKITDLEAQIRLVQETDANIALLLNMPSDSSLSMHSSSSYPASWRSDEFGYNIAAQSDLVRLNGWVDPVIGSWWETSDSPPPSGLIEILISRYTQQEHRYTHDLLPSRFYQSLYNPDSTTGPHPALRNIIFLLGCAYVDDRLSALQPVFLRRTTYYLNQSLAHADRLLDWLEAYTLLGFYHLFYKGGLSQGRHIGATAILFAAACGLHALSPPGWLPSRTASLLSLPSSRDEIRHRVRVWWMVFFANRLASAAGESRANFADEDISTAWELLPESQPGSSAEGLPSTVSSLYIAGSKETYVYGDTANTILCKCVALSERAGYTGVIAAKTPESDEAYWEKFRAADHAIEQVTRSLPSMFEEPRFDSTAPHTVSRASGKTNPFIIFPHILVCDATILLHNRLAQAGNATSRDVCLKAAWRAMPVVRKMLVQEMGGSVLPYAALVEARIFQVFASEYDRLHALGDTQRAKVILPELKVLALMLREHTKHFSLAKLALAVLKGMFPSLRGEPGIF
ncbi:hypothetical protein BOTBODRAFT_30819 [Botryobasidium botryosum FD-172 SS1]|uniref:Zn(2)-C6 fungal-type domain-containing protein n=1 Tax=Botryobasidium botryosum (strain FD-172 SS1) TaxID=930990 RepID=A0A067ML52_BOTB1|nr:hypothetical protein BOTBODRAFT_30819 [Botryobasidium botryosum FD-172 SS1]